MIKFEIEGETKDFWVCVGKYSYAFDWIRVRYILVGLEQGVLLRICLGLI